MSEFEPLERPEETDDGKWVVTVKSEEFRQLFDDGKVHDGNYYDDGKVYATSFFDNELSAHYAATIYYIEHGYDYLEGCYSLDGEKIILEVESQVMKF